TSKKELLKINKKYLKHSYHTDIVTFNYNENNIISGDLFISLPQIKENSKTYNVTYEQELLRVIIHGVFHLLGYNDK
ncbi:MAG: rRNA maturation RNase YbeY, partial [Bacteroidetes bacterium CG_4_10_14_3_um_filter_31_20]